MYTKTKALRGMSVVATAALLSGATLIGMAPASASHPKPDIVISKKDSCGDFALGIDFLRDFPETKDFYDKDGNLVRLISSGRGTTITYSNQTTHETITIDTPGSVSRTEFNDDGSYTVYASAFNGVILFRSDEGGPGATHYRGKLTYTVSAEGVFEVIDFSGQQQDICEELR